LRHTGLVVLKVSLMS